MTDLNYIGISVTGKRDHNEDAYLCYEVHPDVYFFAVADGMGGMVAGEIASKLVIDHCKSFMGKIPPENFQKKNLKSILNILFKECQEALQNYIDRYPDKQGMGTTLCAVLLCEHHYAWGNIGDSRIYLFSKSSSRQLTKDHSYVQEYLDSNGGQISEGIINNYGNILTRSINGALVSPDIYPEKEDFALLALGDFIVLCSDGLITSQTLQSSESWLSIFQDPISVEDAGNAMIQDALKNGSTDNLTIVVSSYSKSLDRSVNATALPSSSFHRKLDGILRLLKRWRNTKDSVIVGILLELISVF